MSVFIPSDAILACAAGLTVAERFALDSIADRDPRLCRAALYDHAREIESALFDARTRPAGYP